MNLTKRFSKLVFLLLLSAGFCTDLSLPVSSEVVLTSFFRELLEETPAGYTIYGNKPIYLGNFCSPEWLIPGSKRHEDASRSYLALKLLKPIERNTEDNTFIIVNNGDDLSKGYQFTIINCEAARKVFQDNLLLFKYKFGWDTSIESLIEQLESRNHSFWSVLGNEPALQGILLGYGTSNSISWERLTAFTATAFSTDPKHPPQKLPQLPTTKEETYDRIASNSKNSQWEKVKEETKDFDNHFIWEPKDNLKVFFAFHKGSKESRLLLESYQKCQNQLDQLLIEKSFLQKTFQTLGIDPQSLSIDLQLPKQETLSHILAKSILYTFSKNITADFFAGMKTAQNAKELASLPTNFENVEFLKILAEETFTSPTRREKVQESEAFFQTIELIEGVRCLIPQKLYTRTINPGKSAQLLSKKNGDILVNYLIKDVNDTPLKGTYRLESPSKLNLKEMIPGLAHGLLGMREGETREVFIHPDFAYGVHSDFGHGSALQIQVELIKICETIEDSNLPFLQPVDVRMQAPLITTCEEFKKLQRKYNYLCGIKTWAHYKKAKNLVNLDDIIELLSSNRIQDPYTEQEREIISLLDWVIYQADKT